MASQVLVGSPILKRAVSVAAALGLMAVVVWSGCRRVPMTGRKQVMLVPETQEIAIGAEAYRETLSKARPSTNQNYVELVNRVGHRIARVSGRPDYEWEFRLIASPKQNAFALPGGKVAVYEGIIPVCRNEAGLAVVMSHEIAHALARHGSERMSHAAIADAFKQAVVLATRDQARRDRQMVLAAYGAASQYGFILPYSREHESEADRVGLILMAKAGYDPREAPHFWQRFAAQKQAEQQPEFLSTHPADERRADDLIVLLPEALSYYQNAPEKFGFGEVIARPVLSSNSAIQAAGAETLRSDGPQFLQPRLRSLEQ